MARPVAIMQRQYRGWCFVRPAKIFAGTEPNWWIANKRRSVVLREWCQRLRHSRRQARRMLTMMKPRARDQTLHRADRWYYGFVLVYHWRKDTRLELCSASFALCKGRTDPQNSRDVHETVGLRHVKNMFSRFFIKAIKTRFSTFFIFFKIKNVALAIDSHVQHLAIISDTFVIFFPRKRVCNVFYLWNQRF